MRTRALIAGAVLLAGCSAILDVWYLPDWHCEFYGLLDCLLGFDSIAKSGPLGPDGAFSVRVADVAHDPALARFRSRGDVCFNLIDARTHNVRYALARPGDREATPAHPCFNASQLSTAPLVLSASARGM